MRNIILAEVLEIRHVQKSHYIPRKDFLSSKSAIESGEDDCIQTRRKLSQAMIPGKHLTRVEIEESQY